MRIKRQNPLLQLIIGISWCSACVVTVLTTLGSSSAQRKGDISAIAIAKHPVHEMILLHSQAGWILQSDLNQEFLLSSFNEGRRWSKIELKAPLQEIFFLDSQHGWATELKDDYSSMLTTSDGGMNWEVICARIPGEHLMITGILFTDVSRGWVVATQPKGLSTVLRTNDGGRTFSLDESLSGKFGLSHAIITLADGSKFWVLGEDSVLHSSDKGQTWFPEVNHANLPGRRKAISFMGGQAFEDGRVFLVGESAGGVIFKSSNFGRDWKLVLESDDAHWFKDVRFWDEKHGCAVGGSALLFCTGDGGDHWEARNVLPKSQFRATSVDNMFEKVFFADGGMRGWVLAGGGFLFETDDGGNSWRRLDLLDTVADK